MQTARKPIARQSESRQQQPKQRATMPLTDVIVFVGLLAAWGWFVQSLEGIDLDTGFLAVYCTVLSMFILKSVYIGLRGTRV